MKTFDWAMVWTLVLFILDKCKVIDVNTWIVLSPMILLIGFSVLYVIIMGIAKGVEDAKKN